MNVEIITPEETIFSGIVEMIRVPGTQNPFQMLKNHAPIISTLKKGKVEIRKTDGEMVKFDLNKGYIKCMNNKISVIIQE